MKTAQLYTKKFDGSRDNFNPIVDVKDILPTEDIETVGKFLMSNGYGVGPSWESVDTLPAQSSTTANKFLKSTGLVGSEVWTDVVVPTKVSDLTNDTGFITAADDITGNAATASLANSALSANIATSATTAVTATTANKVAYSLTMKDTNGANKTFDGSAALDLTGGVNYATTSLSDSLGQQIDSTYIKGLSINGRTITYVKGDDTSGSFDTQDISGKADNNGTYPNMTVGNATRSTTSAKADTIQGSYTSSGGQQNPNYFGTNKVGFLMMNTTVNGDSHYKDWIIMDCYSGNDVGGAVALGVDRQDMKAFIMGSDADRTTWSRSAEFVTTVNYRSYAHPRLNYGAVVTGISTSYTAPSDGMLMFNLDAGSSNMTINGSTVYIGGNDASNEGPCQIIVATGDACTLPGTAGTRAFVPFY